MFEFNSRDSNPGNGIRLIEKIKKELAVILFNFVFLFRFLFKS
jgi:hypothetical protein